MTYIVVKYSEDGTVIANADCMVGVLLDFLRERLKQSVPKDSLLDLCDEDGWLCMISGLPPNARGLCAIKPRRVYRAVARPLRRSDGLFQPLAGGELPSEQAERMLRSEMAWELAMLRLEAFGGHTEASTDVISKLMVEIRDSDRSDTGLGRLLTRVGRDASSERLNFLQSLLRIRPVAIPLSARSSRAATKKRNPAGRSRSTMSNKSSSSRSSNQHHSPGRR